MTREKQVQDLEGSTKKNQQQTPQTRIPPTTIAGRFVRTPEKVNPLARRIDPAAIVIAHSVPSRRHAPNGVTFDEIMVDHEAQSRSDGWPPLPNLIVVHWLTVAINAGLVEVLS